MSQIVYSSDVLGKITSHTDPYGVSLWKMLTNGNVLAAAGRRKEFYESPPWLLLFRAGPTSEARQRLDAIIDTFPEVYGGEVEDRFVFHTKTGKLSRALYEYLLTFTDERARFEFIGDYVAYMKGLLKRFPFPPLASVPLLKTLKFKWFSDQDPYVKDLRSSYQTKTHTCKTQDVTLFFETSLVDAAQVLLLPPTRAACFLEILRRERAGR